MYKTYLIAQNAARKEFGKDWKQAAKVEKNAGGEWQVNVIATKDLEPLNGAAMALQSSAAALIPNSAPKGWELIDTSTEDEAHEKRVLDGLEKALDELTSALSLPGQAIDLELDADEEHGLVSAEADKAANAALVAEATAEAVAKGEWITKSSIKLPTKKVWAIADHLYDLAEEKAKESGEPVQYPTRKEVQDFCVTQGIASGTARTQFQHWFKCRNDSKAAPIATIGKDGKISMPGKE